MGRRGPPPKPSRLKVAAGNPGKRPLNPQEPRPAVEAPRMPAWLPRRAKAEWQRIVPELLGLGLLTRIDLGALASYCVAVGELEEATRTLDKEGRVCVQPIMDKTGEKVGERLRPHPAVAMQRSAASLVKAFAVEFGLSAASRTRVHGRPVPPAGTNDREKRFFGVIE